MTIKKRFSKKILASACVVALAGNGLGIGQAQDKKTEATPKPASNVAHFYLDQDSNEKSSTQGNQGFVVADDSQGPQVAWATAGVPGQQGDNVFQFFSQEMSFESRMVKGAPFSADTLSETVQTLADGNRIVQRTEGRAYRDGEGRTRQERSFQMNGANEQQRSINIYDPVANVSIFLEPWSKVARKMPSMLGGAAIGGRMVGAPSGGAVSFYRSEMPESVSITSARISGGPQPAPAAPLGAFSRRLRVAENAVQGSAIKKVEPVYPQNAKDAKIEGPVQVEIAVNENGDVVKARAVNGNELLREAAVEAAKQWKFKPTELQGKPVEVNGLLTFHFTLEGGKANQLQQQNVAFASPATTIMAISQPKTESLGKQMVEGVECEGSRTVTTIPAGTIGNERAIETVFENWFSPELKMMILSKHSDPRFGETTYRVTNINRAEPDSGLFQVPSDYTVKEGPPFAFATQGLPAEIAPMGKLEKLQDKVIENQKNKPDQN